MVENIRCKRCNKVLKSEESIKLGYGKKCYRIDQLQKAQITSPNNDLILEVVERVRKLELDNNFMKHQLKYKTIAIDQNIESIERIKADHHRPERNKMKIQFNVVVKELKVIFHENFDYHEILKPVTMREEPEDVLQSIELLH